MKQNQDGFTIPELMTVLVVTVILSAVIIFFGFNFWRSGALLQADQETLTTRLNAGDYIRENVGESTGLIVQNSIPDTHTLLSDPNQPTGEYWQELHAVSPVNTPVGGAGTITPLFYFRKFSTDSDRNVIMNSTNPYEDEVILYLNGSTKQLLARTLANPNAPDNRQKTTCPPYAATPSCPADKVVAGDVESIDLRYFSRNGAVLNYQSSTDPLTGLYNGPDFPLVEVVELTINLQTKASFEKSESTKNNTIIRISLRNG